MQRRCCWTGDSPPVQPSHHATEAWPRLRAVIGATDPLRAREHAHHAEETALAQFPREQEIPKNAVTDRGHTEREGRMRARQARNMVHIESLVSSGISETSSP